MNGSKCLVIVQNRPTQFDVPLYAKIHAEAIFDLVVFYTEVNPTTTVAIDKETTITPQWDHLEGLYYRAHYVRSAIDLKKQIIALRPNHVIICGWYPRQHALLALLLRLGGYNIGVRSDNTLEHTKLSRFRGRLKRTLMFLWPSLYTAWHPVGTLARQYLEKLSVVQRPVFYFPYAIDTEWFAENAARFRTERQKWRQHFGLQPDDFVVLGVMKWTDREDPLTLVDAVLKSAVDIPKLKLLLVGGGPLHNLIELRATDNPGYVIMPGYAKYSELPMYYAISDLFVHPAASEPYGVSVQEAMSCGLPVIVSDKVGAAIDFLEPGLNGEQFRVGNVVELAQHLTDYSARLNDQSIAAISVRKASEWSYVKTLDELQKCLTIKV